MPRFRRIGAGMSDIEIYLDSLKLIHAAGGEGAEVLFHILSGHSKGFELPANARFLQFLIAAYVVNKYRMRDILSGSHLVAHTWANRPALICVFLGCSPMADAFFVA